MAEGERMSIYRASRSIKRKDNSLYNTLRSIYHDSIFVSEIAQLWPDLPLLANLRCGLWYSSVFHDTCYFKSTDGHSNNCSFSTSRLNLHVAHLAGWAAFRNILAEINDGSRYILPNQHNSEPSERLPGLSDDVGAGFISGHSSQPAPTSELNVDRSVELPPQDEVGGLGLSKVIRADQKRFFFDLGSNNRGHFLRISEVAGADRSSIILPLSGLKQFHEMVGHFVEITKDRIEGMTGANIRTVESSQR